MPSVITQQHIAQAVTYAAYREKVDAQFAAGGPIGALEGPDILEYTRLNIQRMKRIDKTAKLSQPLLNAIAAINKPILWLVISEGWCGDAAQSVPLLVKAAGQNPNITIRFIFRDEHPEVMDEYLTEGGRSVPKLIALAPDSLQEVGVWGPRPEPAQQMVRDYKKNQDVAYAVFTERLHAWYAADKTVTLQQELTAAITQWANA